MKINTKIRYSLRMVICLAESGKIVNTVDMGERMMVSPKYLRKLAGKLEKGLLIKSVQGIYGGYELNMDPKDITLGMILDSIDEGITFSDCLDKKGCPLDADCLTKPVWSHLEQVIQKEFYKITVRQILDGDLNRKT